MKEFILNLSNLYDVSVEDRVDVFKVLDEKEKIFFIEKHYIFKYIYIFIKTISLKRFTYIMFILKSMKKKIKRKIIKWNI